MSEFKKPRREESGSSLDEEAETLLEEARAMVAVATSALDGLKTPSGRTFRAMQAARRRVKKRFQHILGARYDG